MKILWWIPFEYPFFFSLASVCNRGAQALVSLLLSVDASDSDQLFWLCRLFHLGMNQPRVQGHTLNLLSLFSETGPGCVCCSTLWARWTQPVLKVTPIRAGWLADWVFRRTVVICMSLKTSLFYKAFIKLICAARHSGLIWFRVQHGLTSDDWRPI